MSAVFATLMLVTAIFLILLVLVQRGRGGGLAGALGGMGGQSAFGTKAGDLFTRITIGVAAFWILLCIGAVKYYGGSNEDFGTLGSAAAQSSAPIGASGSSPVGTAAPTDNAAPASTSTPGGSATTTDTAPPVTAAPVTTPPSADATNPSNEKAAETP